MAVLAADFELNMKDPGNVRSLDVVADDCIYKGSLVAIDAAGAAVPMTDAAAEAFIGIAVKKADNTGGALGDIEVEVYTTGCFELTCTTTAAADLGKILYCNDDNSVEDKTAATNDSPVGVLLNRTSATLGWIEIGLWTPGIASA